MAMRAVYGIAALLWMGLIGFLSDQPGLDVPALFPGQDKVAHMVIFGILGALYTFALWPRRHRLRWREVGMITVLVALYGLTDEYHQTFVPGRDASIADLLADTAGGLLAALVLMRERQST